MAGNEEGEGAEDPHEDGAKDLIVEHGDIEGVGVVDVEAVDGAVAEGEEGREQGHSRRRERRDRQSLPSRWGARGLARGEGWSTKKGAR